MDYAIVAKTYYVEEGDLRPREDEDFPIEKARLRSVFIWTILSTMVIIGYGWSLERKLVSQRSPSYLFACYLFSMNTRPWVLLLPCRQ